MVKCRLCGEPKKYSFTPCATCDARTEAIARALSNDARKPVGSTRRERVEAQRERMRSVYTKTGE